MKRSRAKGLLFLLTRADLMSGGVKGTSLTTEESADTLDALAHFEEYLIGCGECCEGAATKHKRHCRAARVRRLRQRIA